MQSERRRRLAWLPIVGVLVSPWFGEVAVAETRAEEIVPGHVLVRFRSSVKAQVEGARWERELGDRVHLFHAHDERPERTRVLLARLAADPSVEWAEPEHIRRPHTDVTTNDPLLPNQWSLPMIHLLEAWNRSQGSPSVVVAVLDTGILPHPDLVSRYLDGYDFITDAQNAGDGSGRDPNPKDEGTSEPTSSALHGLHVTGILGAHVNNSVGIAGVDWNCRILPVRVLGVRMGQGTDGDIADGIRWAAGLPVAGVPQNTHPAGVINMSFGGPGLSNTLQLAIDAATARGSVVVASAGNDAADTAGYAPAGQNHVIAVAAVDPKGKLASYSNRGARVDLMAPGGDLAQGPMLGIISTLMTPMDGYTYLYYHGTSQAAPHVTGVVSLMKAIAPSLGYEPVRKILLATADPTARCMEGCGAGLVDANAAVAAASVAAGCVPPCGLAEVCSNGRCVKAGTVGGTDVNGGCAIGAREPPPPLSMMAALLLVAWVVGRRARRV